MQQTLFILPHWLFSGPLLIAWLVIGLIILIGLFYRHGNTNEAWSFVPVYAIVAAVIYWIIPNLEVPGIDPSDPTGPMIPSGLAIRGYGLFLLTAIVSGVTLAAWRSSTIGATSDQIMQLAFWMMICGLAGARAFYVIQKPEEFFVDGFSMSTLSHVLNMTKGGMVVYGSLIGGSLAGLVFLWFQKMPLLKTADLIAPGMVLGLAIGRIGCLMNGCCYGGVCEPPYPALHFPAGSPPYMRQLVEGDLLGIDGLFDESPESEFPLTVESIDANSIAQQFGLVVGDRVAIRVPSADYFRFQKQNPENQQAAEIPIFIDTERTGRISLTLDQLPARSRPTHPTQVYSSINALLLCLLLWYFWTVRRHDGEVFALMLILYSIARFLIEIVRQDERGQFGTELTISQWVSIAMIAIGFALFVYARIAGPQSSPEPDSSGTL
ncbi:MAG: prolipoprotein diacylglyceryl transferase [Planctomycetota bacterium]